MLKTGYNGNDMSEKRPLEQHPLGRLDNEDLNMVLAFVLRSGSVKELAAHFGVSYPTMRPGWTGSSSGWRRPPGGEGPIPWRSCWRIRWSRGTSAFTRPGGSVTCTAA